MGTKYVFEHPSTDKHIEVDSPKAIYKAAEAARAAAAEKGEAPPAWARNPGECKLVKSYEPEPEAKPVDKATAAAELAKALGVSPEKLAAALAAAK